jgi:hypothetical protein
VTRKRILAAILLLLLAAAAGLVATVIRHGMSARETPTGIEALVARQVTPPSPYLYFAAGSQQQGSTVFLASVQYSLPSF